MSKMKVCGTCKYSKIEKVDTKSKYFSHDWICTNTNGDYYGLETDYDDSCDQWEQKEKEQKEG